MYMLIKLKGKWPESGHADIKNSEKMTETKLIYKIGNSSILFLQDNENSSNVACVVLLIFLVFTLILNSSVLVSLLFSDLKSNPYSASVATLAAASVLDGIFNVTSSIVFHASWEELAEQYGETNAKKWCRTNATTLQFTGMIQSFALGVLVYDRQSFLFVRDEENIRKKDIILKWMLFISVVVSILMALPIWFGIFTTTFFKNRMSCSPAYATAKPVTVMLAILIIVIYLLTWVFTLRVSFLVVRKVLNNRRRLLDLSSVARQRTTPERDSFRGICNSSTELWSQISGKSEERQLHILTGLLVVSFMLAVWPNIIAVQITQFYKTYNESLDFDFFNHTHPPLDLRQIQTDIFDSVFSWTRFGYNLFLPVIVLLIHSEVRGQCRMTFCCFGKPRDFSARKKKKEKKPVADNAIPVLFATSEGLHLRILKNDPLNGEPSFLVKFCDFVLNESPENTNETREVSFVQLRENNLKESKFGETFVATPRKSFGGTYVKLMNEFDRSKNSNKSKTATKLDAVEENSASLSSLAQRMNM